MIHQAFFRLIGCVVSGCPRPRALRVDARVAKAADLAIAVQVNRKTDSRFAGFA